LKSKRELWLERFAEVIQVGRVGKQDARDKLALAGRNLQRAERHLESDPDLALISAETAIVNAADALLARDGYRIRGKTGAHEARIRYPGLPKEFQVEAARLERARALRSAAMYDHADLVSKAEAAELVEVARKVVKAAVAALGR
jgi:hypothetical protein